MERCESRLEKYIKDYVYNRVTEEVYLYLSDSITIRPVRKRGNVLLATLWANILQHESNFPPASFVFRRRRLDGVDSLVLDTKEIRITVDMTTGTLTIEGQFVYDWFTQKFRNLLDNYDKVFAAKWVFSPTPTGDLPASDRSPESDYHKTETEAYLLLEGRGSYANSELGQKIEDHSVHLVPTVGDLSIAKPIWSVNEVEHQLKQLTTGGVYNSFDYIYPLWRSVMDQWFSEAGSKIYASSPILDAERLQEIVDIILEHRTTANLEALYTSFQCDPIANRNAGSLQKIVAGNHTQVQLQTYIEYKVFRRMVYPLRKLQSAFLAKVSAGRAAVLSTGASFHGVDFVHDKLATVVFVTMTEAEFITRFIQPVTTPAVATLL